MADQTYYGFSDLYHAKRRKQITEKHTELRSLMKIDPSFKYVAAACALTHAYIAYLLNDSPLGFVLFMGCFVGTLFNCAIANSLHEIVHDLAINGSAWANKVFGNFVNCSLGWPSVAGYYRSHRNHHSYLGSDYDVKYPSMSEAQMYDDSVLHRLKFIFLHPLNGGPRWEKYVGEKASDYVFYNTISVYTFDLLMLIFVGYKPLVYMLISFWLNDCIFIQGSKNFADHWVDEQTTYTNSYYGWVNMINFNIGYHREHHDFPNVPGRYLAAVYKFATEFYSDKTYIATCLFTDIWQLLIAQPGKGLTKYANKLNIRQVAMSGTNLDSC